VQTASNSDSYFVSFNPQTGATTPVGPMMNDYYDWMAFDPTTLTLYGQNDISGDVYSMDTSTGIETHVSPFSPYSYNLVIFGDGSFLSNDYSDLVSGSISTWSGSVVGPYTSPDLVSNGTNTFFTSTDVFTPALTPPTQSITGTQGAPIAPTQAYVATHFVSSPTYTISPALPAGLHFDSSTGVLSGIPSASQSARSYTVTASDGSRTATAMISIVVSAALAQTGVDGAATLIFVTAGCGLFALGAVLFWFSRRRRSR
jgi:hypothetical protein